MRRILVVCLFFFFNSASSKSYSFGFLKHNPPPPPTGTEIRVDEVITENFVQKLDHFDPNNEKTWIQQYFENSQYFNTTSNNVVFLLLGGESDSETSKSWMTYGSWIVSAKNYGALLFQLEHRFYGKSQPFIDLATENLQYLSSDQALADASNFIKAMNAKYSLAPDVKWIAFGISYSASLAAWLRLKEPDLVYGAVASSAPLVAKLDFPEYFQVVIDDLASISEQCVETLKTAVEQVEDLLDNPKPTENVTQIFNLCEPIEEVNRNDLTFQNFYNIIADSFAAVAQFTGVFDASIGDLCDILADESKGKEIYRLYDIIKSTYGTDCIGYNYRDFVNLLKNTDTTGILRQWFYQTCTEFGWFQTTNREDKIFGRGCSINYYTHLCADVFGLEFNSSFIVNQINETNADYGGTDIYVSNVIYAHGSLDPWHAIGLTKTTNPDSPAIYIEGTAHCASMYESSDKELPQLTAAKKEIDRLIGLWLELV